MGTNLQDSNLSSLLKKYYAKDFYSGILFDNHPFFGMLAKEATAGKAIVQPITIGGAQNISATYTDARGGNSKSINRDFTIPYKDLFASFVVDHKEAVAAKKKGDHAYVEAIAHEVGLAMKEFSRNHSLQLFRSSNGSKANVASIVGNVITLSNRYDIVNFGVGMQIIAAELKDGAVKRDGGAAKIVKKINTRLGSIELEDAIVDLAVGDFLFAKGDAGNRFHGLMDWLPPAGQRANLNVPFLGVDRSEDEASLAGIAVDGSAMSFEDALLSAESELQLYNSSPEVLFMNPKDWYRLSVSLSSKERIEKACKGAGAMATHIGYTAFHVGSTGVKIVVDAGCPQGYAFMLDMSTWKLCHLGSSVINDWDEDSLTILRDGAGAVRGEMYTYGNLICTDPKNNCIITLPVG